MYKSILALSHGGPCCGLLFIFRARVVSILPIDIAYFQAHPDAWEYRRAPLPDEWGELAIPFGARVHVYLVTGQCVVRALEGPDGERLVTSIDHEATAAIR